MTHPRVTVSFATRKWDRRGLTSFVHVVPTGYGAAAVEHSADYLAARNDALIAVLYDTGLRVSEALGLEVDLLHLSDGNKIYDVKNRLRHATVKTTEQVYSHFDRV